MPALGAVKTLDVMFMAPPIFNCILLNRIIPHSIIFNDFSSLLTKKLTPDVELLFYHPQIQAYPPTL